MNANEMSKQAPAGVPADASQPLPELNQGDAPAAPQDIRIGKTVTARETAAGVVAEVFTMSIGNETIPLLPLKNWSQLDIFKWRARGLLPGTPAGLEVTTDGVRIGGEKVSTWDADGCERLQKAFNEWLAVERQGLELAKAKAQAQAQPPAAPLPNDEDTVHFQLDFGNAAQPRLKCMEGNKLVKMVALNQQGLNALFEESLMRKPQSIKFGALHDWIEIDGQLFRFKDGAAAELERILNERYVFIPDDDGAQDVLVSPNPASPTGFDIQFPASPNGLVETRKRHLVEESIDLLQDPKRCRVLRKETIAKLTPPYLVFKRKTADGGEAYLEPGPDTMVFTTSDDGQPKSIDLSKSVNLLELGSRELTAVFNHPAVNRRARLAQTTRQQAA